MLYLIPTKTTLATHLKFKFGCDNQGNAIAPTNYNDLNSRTITANFILENPMPALTGNTVFSCDVTTAVQEIINLADWTYGTGTTGNLAILVMDYGSDSNSAAGEFASFENDSHNLLFPVIGMSYSGNVVTLNCSNFFASGNSITVSGIDAGYGTANIDGTWVCGSGTNQDNIVFTVSSPPTGTTPQTTSHGTVSPTPIVPTVMAYATKTVTLTAVNNFNIGTRIRVAGVNSGYTVTHIDGDWVCKTGTNATTIVFDVASNPVGTTPQNASHGTISRSGIPLLVIKI
jgi:hypothetical protein